MDWPLYAMLALPVLLGIVFHYIPLVSDMGVVNKMLQALGIGSVMFLSDNRWFPFTIVFTHIWKEFGYGTIVYLAAIAGVNMDLYEASAVDGAGHFRQMVHVTIPAVIPSYPDDLSIDEQRPLRWF